MLETHDVRSNQCVIQIPKSKIYWHTYQSYITE